MSDMYDPSAKLSERSRRQLFALLHRAGMADSRADLVLSFTRGRSSSVADMTDGEARAMIRKLSKEQTGRSRRGKMMSKCVALLCLLGYTKDGKPDYERIDAWMKAKTSAKKVLPEQTDTQVQETLTQIQKWYERATDGKQEAAAEP